MNAKQAADRLEAEMPWADSRVREAVASENEVLVIQATPDVIKRFRELPGTDDFDRLCGLLAQAA
jgi:hypothetical protein